MIQHSVVSLIALEDTESSWGRKVEEQIYIKNTRLTEPRGVEAPQAAVPELWGGKGWHGTLYSTSDELQRNLTGVGRENELLL